MIGLRPAVPSLVLTSQFSHLNPSTASFRDSIADSFFVVLTLTPVGIRWFPSSKLCLLTDCEFGLGRAVRPFTQSHYMKDAIMKGKSFLWIT